MFIPIRIVIRQYFPQLLLSTNSEKNFPIWMLMSLYKSLFLPSVLIWRKTRKRKPWTLSLRRPGSAEQAQFFSVFRSNGGKREASAKASHAREEEWKKTNKKTPPKNTCTPMHTKIEKPQKPFWEWWIAREVMIWIKTL